MSTVLGVEYIQYVESSIILFEYHVRQKIYILFQAHTVYPAAVRRMNISIPKDSSLIISRCILLIALR